MTQRVQRRKVALLVEERHWTQEQFARLLGVTRQRMSILLNESKRPAPLTVNRIASELKVRPDELVDERGNWLMVECDA